ncbi:hypothetical protein [Burkholderia sp. LMU1-1-1.1]|uniref:hypothetical protein n=1 Tax=Burkholderia sp. LMU1-1-1.1 TaxID=3135266 RepID=UPI0034294420
MRKLIAELRRLYLLDDRRYSDADLEPHLRGERTIGVDLANGEGLVRALVIEFRKLPDDGHWSQLCETANALQTELGLPAPAVSVSGGDSYGLWLSLETPVPVARLRQLKALLHQAYFAQQDIDIDKSVVELPPCLHMASGLWAAFINPGMGASFADDLGLDMQPPIAAQTAFLEGLRGITAAEFEHALEVLSNRPGGGTGSTAPAAPAKASATPAGLLLKDATIEDIVRHLQERNIEPTFRFIK